MTARYASQSEVQTWDELVIQNPNGGSVFQTQEFAEIKESNYWEPRYIVVGELYILVLERKIPILGSFWYVPKGPGVTSADELGKLLPELRDFAKDNNVFAIKFEPELLDTTDNTGRLTQLGLSKSRVVQAANTVIVNLAQPIDAIVAGFSSKARGNIRAAQNAGVTTEVVPITDANCDFFYNMMAQTIAGRSHVRSKQYFKNFWQTHSKTGHGIFMFAKSGKEVLAMDFIMILGTKAARKDAASTRDHSVRGASALLEMNAIKYLKSQGVTQYDLYGAPPSDQIKNPNHPYYGFGTFKASFNSQITDYVGCYDLVIKPTAYKIWHKNGERIIHKIHHYRHKDLYY